MSPKVEQSIEVILDYFFETNRTKDASKQIEELEMLNRTLGENKRAQLAEEMRKGLVVTFRTEDAKKKYFDANRKKKTESINEQVKTFMIDLPDYIIERMNEDELFHKSTVGKIEGIRILQSVTELLPQAKKVDFPRYIEAVKKFLANIPEEQRHNVCTRILNNSFDALYGGYTLGISPELEEKMDQATDTMQDKLRGIILNDEQMDIQMLQAMEADVITTHMNAAESVTYKTKVDKGYLDKKERIQQAESDVLRVMETENLPIEEKKERIDEIVERHNLTMDDLAKSALRGKRAATRESTRDLLNENDKSRGVWC